MTRYRGTRKGGAKEVLSIQILTAQKEGVQPLGQGWGGKEEEKQTGEECREKVTNMTLELQDG